MERFKLLDASEKTSSAVSDDGFSRGSCSPMRFVCLLSMLSE